MGHVRVQQKINATVDNAIPVSLKSVPERIANLRTMIDPSMSEISANCMFE